MIALVYLDGLGHFFVVRVSAEDLFVPIVKHYHVPLPNLDTMGFWYSTLYLGLITPLFLTACTHCRISSLTFFLHSV